jgi:hypothetical protein
MKDPFHLNNVSYVTFTKFRLFQVQYSVSALKDPDYVFLSKDPVFQIWIRMEKFEKPLQCTSALVHTYRYPACSVRKNTFSVL